VIAAPAAHLLHHATTKNQPRQKQNVTTPFLSINLIMFPTIASFVARR
jgi:hypothetical protein